MAIICVLQHVVVDDGLIFIVYCVIYQHEQLWLSNARAEGECIITLETTLRVFF